MITRVISKFFWRGKQHHPGEEISIDNDIVANRMIESKMVQRVEELPTQTQSEPITETPTVAGDTVETPVITTPKEAPKKKSRKILRRKS